jgi:hypothetical protein
MYFITHHHFHFGFGYNSIYYHYSRCFLAGQQNFGNYLNKTDFSRNAQSNQGFSKSTRLGSDFPQPKAGLAYSTKGPSASKQADRPIFAFNTLYHKRPKDAQPQDEIMRSEGLGFFPTSGRNVRVLTRALLANLQSGYRFALLARLYHLFP